MTCSQYPRKVPTPSPPHSNTSPSSGLILCWHPWQNCHIHYGLLLQEISRSHNTQHAAPSPDSSSMLAINLKLSQIHNNHLSAPVHLNISHFSHLFLYCNPFQYFNLNWVVWQGSYKDCEKLCGISKCFFPRITCVKKKTLKWVVSLKGVINISAGIDAKGQEQCEELSLLCYMKGLTLFRPTSIWTSMCN